MYFVSATLLCYDTEATEQRYFCSNIIPPHSVLAVLVYSSILGKAYGLPKRLPFSPNPSIISQALEY